MKTMIPKEKRDEMRKEAQETLKMIDNYPKKFDVTVYFWTEGKNHQEAESEVKEALRNCGLTYNIGDITEVNDY